MPEKRKRKRKSKYLNNKDLLKQIEISISNNKMTDELAKMLITLVKRYSERANFINYTYIEDMRGYALMELMRSWTSFKPEKSNNPFAFFTQCIKNSFRQFLNKEKKQRDIRDAVLVDTGLSPSFTYQLEHATKTKVEDEEDWTQQQKNNHEKINDTDDILTY